jgi:hypothetical protein
MEVQWYRAFVVDNPVLLIVGVLVIVAVAVTVRFLRRREP